MIDLHCHILPGIDDGPSAWEESIEMARMAYQDGIRTIVATPHIMGDSPSPDTVDRLVHQLNSFLREHGIGIEVLPGAELKAHLGARDAMNYTLNNGRHVLIEFQHNFISKNTPSLIFDFILNGLTPIISHIERSPSVLEKPGLLKSMVEMGCLIQITATSVTGGFGPEIRACALYLLKHGMAHVLASDAHSSTWRPPMLSDALRECEKVAGAKYVSAMVHDTPRLIIEGAGKSN